MDSITSSLKWGTPGHKDPKSITKNLLDIQNEIPPLTTIIYDLSSPNKFITITTKMTPEYLKYGQLNIIGLKDQKPEEAIDIFLNKFNVKNENSTQKQNNLLDTIKYNYGIGIYFVKFTSKNHWDLWIKDFEAYCKIPFNGMG